MVPLHMAMVAPTVARGGTMMKPYVVARHDRQSGPGAVDHRARGVVDARPARETAATLNTLMQQVAVNGTASCCIALDNGIPVAAKTGTAQLNGPASPSARNAWIIAFAPADHPQYAIAVMLNDVNAEISAVTGGTCRRAARPGDAQLRLRGRREPAAAFPGHATTPARAAPSASAPAPTRSVAGTLACAR